VIPAAILQPPDQEQLAHQQFTPLSFNKHIQNNSPAIPDAIFQSPDQEQLTSDSRRHPSTARSRTTNQCDALVECERRFKVVFRLNSLL
jgi:hypothetical protein